MRSFIGTKNTSKISKFDLDAEGNEVTQFNKRTMAKKALKAFLKGETYYKYKGEQYVIPAMVNIEELKKQADGGRKTSTNVSQVSGDSSGREGETG
jgi:ribosomal protein S5